MTAAQIEPDTSSGPEPAYRRRISVQVTPGHVVADMEDYVHHFRVVLDHQDGVVTSSQGVGVRVPWTTCPIGAAGVASLAGTAIDADAFGDRWVLDRTTQCTHVIDLAGVALRHAAGSSVQYDAWVTPAGGPRRTAVLLEDGAEVLRWELAGQVLQDGPFAGLEVRSQELKARLPGLPDARAREHVVVLRRACHIAPSRTIDMDAHAVAAEISILDSSCHTLQPGVATVARRVQGSTRPTEQLD